MNMMLTESQSPSYGHGSTSCRHFLTLGPSLCGCWISECILMMSGMQSRSMSGYVTSLNDLHDNKLICNIHIWVSSRWNVPRQIWLMFLFTRQQFPFQVVANERQSLVTSNDQASWHMTHSWQSGNSLRHYTRAHLTHWPLGNSARSQLEISVEIDSFVLNLSLGHLLGQQQQHLWGETRGGDSRTTTLHITLHIAH